MFNMNLSDRLKAAVNTLEATGSSLQARAIGQGQGHDPATLGATSISRQSSPSASTSMPTSTARDRPISPRVATSPALLSPTGKDGGETVTSTSTSPTKTAGNYIASTGMLAENALSGLRKSFHFTRERPSLDGSRPNLSPTAGPGAGTVVGASTSPQELKDLPTSPAAGPSSRPSSPGRFLSSNFSLGSDPNSSSGTPQLRSPRPGSKGLNASGSPRPRSPARATMPPPDPSDPATFPLPPSPTLGASTPLAAPTPKYADPLGASPLLHAEAAAQEPPTFGLQEATPTEEKGIGLGIGMHGDLKSERGGGSDDSARENGEPPEPADESQVGADSAELQQRYDDLSKKHDKLVRQVDGVNKVLRELTPLESGTEDAEALEGWVRMMNGKVTMITEEMKRLQDKINLQESRIEELRDTHRLEGTSQTDLIAKLRTQLSTAESNLASKASELLTLGQLRSDLTKAQTTAKEEEEKRTKAISLLKTVRMKLVKAEKDKEEAEKDRAEERAERSRAGEEVEKVKAEREREVNALRKGFERELASARDRYEKDLQTKKAAWELEMITTKAAHAKELSNKATKVNGLEAIVQELSNTKNEQFELLQSRQAEVESSRAELETLRNRTKELEFQLREADERCAMLEEGAATSASGRPAESNDRGRSLLGVGLPDGGSLSRSPSRSGSYSQTSAGEVQRLLAEAESRSEAKLSDLRFKIRSLEKERNEAEEEWAVKLQERVHELEKLRRVIAEKEGEYAESLRKRDEKDARIAEGNEARKVLEKEIKGLKAKIEEMKEDVEVAADGERLVKDELSTLRLQLSTIQAQLEESRAQYANQRSANKTLRDELRKVQHSVQLMERQRNPGVGYWSANPAAPNSGINVASASANGGRSGEGTPTPIKERTEGEARRSMESVATAKDSVAGSDKKQDEEEVNLEYLRNVILQFLENKEMRPNLVRVLSVILRFTPQELRRLNAKLLS